MSDIEFTLDGKPITARPGETILQAADRHGVAIPRLCHSNRLRPDGNCRACVIEIEGERTLAPSCCRTPTPGMVAAARSGRAATAQKIVVELLLSEVASAGRAAPSRVGTTGIDIAATHAESTAEGAVGDSGDAADGALAASSELDFWARQLGVGKPRFANRPAPASDRSHPAIAVDLAACIQCTRCVRACRELQVNDVIGYAHRGHDATIVFDLADRLGESSCVACGECVAVCPTGALSSAAASGGAEAPAERRVDSLCPYCGVGCQVTYHVRGEHIVRVEGRDGPANGGRLCVKGRYGFDYVHHRQRLTAPLVRRDGVPKDASCTLDPEDVDRVFRRATWDEVLDLAAGRLRAIRDDHGPQALAGFGSAKGSNEEAYLFQKLVRTGFRTNNVDHCTRLCHASSVAALLEGIGSGAVSNPVLDVLRSDVVFVIGSNPIVNHPVAATWIKNAVRQGARLVLADPRRSELARHATHYLQFRPDTDVALLNAMLHVVVAEDLVEARFIAERTEGYEALRANVARFSPEAMAPVCGIPAATIREVARLYATARAAMILWGMGVSQHVHGTDNARCLIALALATGQIGRPGTGLHPLRGQNNVQGASDSGLIPMMYPDYQRVANAQARAKFEALWGVPLDPNPGLTVVEVMDAILAGRVRGMYVMGENPAMSDPDLGHARGALAKLDWLVVQDIFPTETAMLADVVLPASAFPEKTGTFTNTDRLVQLGRQALRPPGEARGDLELIGEMARRLGLDWHYGGPRAVFEEMRRAMPSIAGITWERLETESAVTHPCEREGDAGTPVVFTQSFPTPTGRARFVPADLIPANEQPDADYPMVLITGRQLEHWHTGSMTRRTAVLDAIEPTPTATLHSSDLERLGVVAGDLVTVATRRGAISLHARADDGTPPGAVFVPFCYVEAAANLLTNPALDPYGKIPEFKYCAARVTPDGTQRATTDSKSARAATHAA